MKKIIFPLFVLTLSTLTLQAVTTLTTTSGEVKFTAIGKPGFLKIKGESKETFPSGSIKIENGNATGNFEFDLKSLDTGINLRNEHMKDKYLQVGQYPTAQLSIKNFPIDEKDLITNFKKDFKGVLTLHNVTKDINGNIEFTGSSKKAIAHFTIKVSDFKIDVPQYMGVTVSETVDIDTILQFK